MNIYIYISQKLRQYGETEEKISSPMQRWLLFTFCYIFTCKNDIILTGLLFFWVFDMFDVFG